MNKVTTKKAAQMGTVDRHTDNMPLRTSGARININDLVAAGFHVDVHEDGLVVNTREYLDRETHDALHALLEKCGIVDPADADRVIDFACDLGIWARLKEVSRS